MIEVKDLTFQYTKERVIEHVSFCAKPGEITVLVGANGAGKTTLLKCIAGLQKAEGCIRILGKNMAKLSRSARAEMLSYLGQGHDCDAELNVYEIILLGRVRHLSFKVGESDMALVSQVMEMMSLTQFAGRKINELSGGQRQLVFIAQTLIKDPQILIMDEPTSALDLNHQYVFMEFLTRITKEKNFTTLITLHHLDIAARFANRVVVLNDKKVYAEDVPERALTAQMLRDVYKVNAEIVEGSDNRKHIVTLGAI